MDQQTFYTIPKLNQAVKPYSQMIVLINSDFQMPYLKLSKIVNNVVIVMISAKSVDAYVNVMASLNMKQPVLIIIVCQTLIKETLRFCIGIK